MTIDKMNELYIKLYKYNLLHGYAPDYRTICKMTGVNSTSTVYNYINSLKKYGYLDNEPTCPRSFIFLKDLKDIILYNCVTEVMYTQNFDFDYDCCYRVINGDLQTTFLNDLFFVIKKDRYCLSDNLLVIENSVVKISQLDKITGIPKILGKIQGMFHFL